jgi:hypothetical protein
MRADPAGQYRTGGRARDKVTFLEMRNRHNGL